MHQSEAGVRDVRITGEGTLGPGMYRDVHVLGSGAIQGDCRCRRFKVHGEAELAGRMDADSLHVFGTLDVRHGLDTKAMHVFGTLSASDDVHGGEVRVFGLMEVHGDLAADTLNIHGVVTVDGGCQAEWFCCRGGVQIEGLLNAGIIRFDLGNPGLPCVVREIGAERIEVRRRRDLVAAIHRIIHPRGSASNRLTASAIEGDVVTLEDTEADVVRGDQVDIGSGCRIRRVEYKSVYHQADDAKVEEVVQV
ncbi:hypothetical protein [Alicyclobacillus shizuokensis]|uniref:hypothetical protein n=1 Tax=Alicyclobacillus shizuokensis TaxID=392014 RepID=UPI0008372778|nr:hypothetical protein [Alicyclobacillus shizuokensis]